MSINFCESFRRKTLAKLQKKHLCSSPLNFSHFTKEINKQNIEQRLNKFKKAKFHSVSIWGQTNGIFTFSRYIETNFSNLLKILSYQMSHFLFGGFAVIVVLQKTHNFFSIHDLSHFLQKKII